MCSPQVLAWAGEGGVGHVFDPVGGPALLEALRYAGSRSRYIAAGENVRMKLLETEVG